MKDLRAVSCDIMTIGQYLQPHARRLPVERYVTPEEFNRWRDLGIEMGFHHVESSPLTRSSYHARQQAEPTGKAENEPQLYADARR
jgi:lipoic acid synthetase